MPIRSARPDSWTASDIAARWRSPSGSEVVEADEAVGRGVDVRGDLRGEGVGQLRRRADHDHARLELEDPRALGRLGEPVREADVARPEQPLVSGGASGSEKKRMAIQACRDGCVRVRRSGSPRRHCARVPPVARRQGYWPRASSGPSSVRCGPLRQRRPRLSQPLAGADREVEVVLRRGQRAGPLRVERARRLVREVEVEDQRAARRVAAEVGRLRGVERGSGRRRRSRCRSWRRGTG